MKWVTFHWSILNGVQDLVVHKDKETALKYFRANFKAYFEINIRFRPKQLPCAYGYPHRKFIGVSMATYNKHFRKDKKDGDE